MRKIKIETGGTGASTRLIDADTGEKLAYVKSAVLIVAGKGPIKAMVTLFKLEPRMEGEKRRVLVESGPDGLEGGGKLATYEEECIVVDISMVGWKSGNR